MSVITSKIGTGGGRDYSTLQSWSDAIPADLYSLSQQWIGECYNDSEFLQTSGGATLLSISGHVTDATYNIILRPATGQGFRDNASVNTNPLAYDQSKGVGIRNTGTYGTTFIITNDYVTLDGLQVKNSASSSDCLLMYGVYAGRSVQNCIVDNSGNGTSKRGIYLYSSTSKASNCAVIQRGTSDAIFLGDGGKAYFCSAVKPSDNFSTGNGFSGAYNGSLAKNCASFGFGTGFDSNYTDGSCGYNATNKASAPGSNNQTSVSFTSSTPFVGGANASMDLTLVSGTSLENNGVADGSYTTDIKGYTRSNPPDIGAWEIVSAAASIFLNKYTKYVPAVNRASTY